MVVVNDYRGRSPQHNLTAMVHAPSCSWVASYGHLPYWHPCPSLEEAEATFGDLVKTDPHCLPDQGTHLTALDRKGRP